MDQVSVGPRLCSGLKEGMMRWCHQPLSPNTCGDTCESPWLPCLSRHQAAVGTAPPVHATHQQSAWGPGVTARTCEIKA